MMMMVVVVVVVVVLRRWRLSLLLLIAFTFLPISFTTSFEPKGRPDRGHVCMMKEFKGIVSLSLLSRLIFFADGRGGRRRTTDDGRWTDGQNQSLTDDR